MHKQKASVIMPTTYLKSPTDSPLLKIKSKAEGTAQEVENLPVLKHKQKSKA
jgi:hypothetical protein